MTIEKSEILESLKSGEMLRIDKLLESEHMSVSIRKLMLGNTTFTIHAIGGITEGHRDEILKRCGHNPKDVKKVRRSAEPRTSG